MNPFELSPCQAEDGKLCPICWCVLIFAGLVALGLGVLAIALMFA